MVNRCSVMPSPLHRPLPAASCCIVLAAFALAACGSVAPSGTRFDGWLPAGAPAPRAVAAATGGDLGGGFDPDELRFGPTPSLASLAPPLSMPRWMPSSLSMPRSLQPDFRPQGPGATTPSTTSQAPSSDRDAPTDDTPGWWRRQFRKVASDYGNFYDFNTLAALGVGVGAAALSANSDLDTEIQTQVRQRWTTSGTNAVANNIMWLGDIKYMVPLTAVTAWVGPHINDSVGEWGERTMRGFLLTAPVTLVLQRATGGRRPAATDNNDSSWSFGASSHGVSGHAVVSSVAFLSIAKMSENPWIDGLCYAASAAVAMARVEQGRHYFSQAALGWFIGYLAVEAVDDSYHPSARGTSIAPMLGPNTVGFVVTHRF